MLVVLLRVGQPSRLAKPWRVPAPGLITLAPQRQCVYNEHVFHMFQVWRHVHLCACTLQVRDMERHPLTLHEYLADLRGRAGLTAPDIGAETGRAHTTIGRYESGSTKKVPPQYLAYLLHAIYRQKSKRGRQGAADDAALLKELNDTLAHYYGDEQQYANWVAVRVAVDAWIAEARGNPALGAPLLQQLRACTPTFVGRSREVAQLVTALTHPDDGALVAICGIRAMGGMGKTELAYRVAQEIGDTYPDAQLLLELRGSSTEPLTPEQALQTIISALAPGVEAPMTLPALQSRYRSLLAGRRILILADDARDAAQVRALLPPPGSAMLITSRRRFLVDGMRAAHVIELGGLHEDEAIALLLMICPRIGSTTTHLAARCGYLPLALRIAAARLANDATLSLERYLQQLDDAHQRLEGLADPDDLDQSVAATIGLSYAALDTEAQAVFAQLSVFPASFTREAASAVVGGVAPDALDTTLSLLHRMFLLDYDSARERFDQHDLVRCYGLTQLVAADTVRERHARYAIEVVERAAAQMQQAGDFVLAGLALFDTERMHIYVSWRWAAQGEPTIQTDHILLAFLEAIGSLHVVRFVGQRDFIAVLEATREASVRQGRRDLEQVVLTDLGWAYDHLNQLDLALAAYTQARAIAQERQDASAESLIVTNMAQVAHRANNTHQALAYANEALALAHGTHHQRSTVEALLVQGWILVALRKFDMARTAYQDAWVMTQALDDPRLEAHVLMELGNAALGMGNFQQARQHSRAAVHIAEQIGDWHTRIYANKTLGDILYLSNAPRAALDYYEHALAASRAVGDAVGEAVVLGDMSDAYHALHDLSRAAECHREAIVISRSLGDEDG